MGVNKYEESEGIVFAVAPTPDGMKRLVGSFSGKFNSYDEIAAFFIREGKLLSDVGRAVLNGDAEEEQAESIAAGQLT